MFGGWPYLAYQYIKNVVSAVCMYVEVLIVAVNGV